MIMIISYYLLKMAFVKKNRKMTQEKENVCRDVASSFHNSSYSTSPYLTKSFTNNTTNNKCLRPCMYLERCNKRADGRCGFAHSIDELQPMVCMFDKRCNKFGVENGCTRFHPSLQTKEEYCERSGFSFVLPSPPQSSEENEKEMNEVMDAIEEMADNRIQELQHEIEFLQFVDEQVHQHEMEEQMAEMASS